MELLHATGVRLGLVTNGERWMLVDAPRNETTGYASWYASLWLDEPLILRAFQSLLGARRFFSVGPTETLEALLAESATHQQEVTDQLGRQVRQAVEILVQALDRVDKDRGRTLLQGVVEAQLYQAALTVMMRLVFLLSAEERKLLLLGVPMYDENYAVSTLRAQLRAVADQQGEEVLEHRHDAWARLLATCRVLHGGVEHEAMPMPAYGGQLFDPNRFPFLEGRPAGTTWRELDAQPLPLHNRTVLHLLEALQVLKVKVPGGGPAEARLLSFQALDVEQIGHVYEGLLDHTAVRAQEPVLGLVGGKAREPEIPLATLEGIAAKGQTALADYLAEETGRGTPAIRNALTKVPLLDEARLRAACDNDIALVERVLPYAALLRTDTTGSPVVITPGSIYVTKGNDRRSTGTHYTPRSLTEPIVQYTLEPLVYSGPAEGKPREEWRLRSADELLSLKIRDMTMGSAAFLVQTCRYLAERLLEAWEEARQAHPGQILVIPRGTHGTGDPGEQLVPDDLEERRIIAMRTVADRCIYGVDVNPMAVEMAKLSLWLVTFQKNRPFTLLDHALRGGDSLLGVDLAQLSMWSLDHEGGKPVSWMVLPARQAVEAALMARQKIAAITDLALVDVEEKRRLLAQAEEATEMVKLGGDLLAGIGLAVKPTRKALSEDLLGRYYLAVTTADEMRRVPFTAPEAEKARQDVEALRPPLSLAPGVPRGIRGGHCVGRPTRL